MRKRRLRKSVTRPVRYDVDLPDADDEDDFELFWEAGSDKQPASDGSLRPSGPK